MATTTEFPPVTYSSSFVSYLIQAANETKGLVEENDDIDDIKKNNNSSANNTVGKKTSQISPARLRWRQLARSAFIRKVTQKVTSQSSPSSNDTSHTNGHDNDSTNERRESSSDEELSDSLDSKDLTLLEILALKSLELTAPASDIILKNRSNNWVQLSGHEDSFALAGPGTIWKKRCQDDTEVRAYEALMDDIMCDMVPKFFRDVEYKGDNFIEMQDLLYDFKDAFIMDIKMGSRTFLESEVQNTKARRDLYDKMIKVDPNAPTKEEHELKAVTKLKYMQFRENLSSSSNLGFRIEGYKTGESQLTNDLKMVKTREEVKSVLQTFLLKKSQSRLKLIERLKQLNHNFENSSFFKSHEVIGSSLLIIYNNNDVGVWMIDFAKTEPLPHGITIDHKSPWRFGNREDGYLFGLNNLIEILEECD